MISFSSDVKSRMGVIIRPESEVYSTVQANVVEFGFPIGSVRGRSVRLDAGTNQNRAAAVESRQRGGGCRPSLQAVPGGALSRAAATSSAGVHTEDHLEARSHFDVATGSASSMGESASTSATGASGGNFRVSSILPLIAAESTADRGSTPRASTTYGGVLVSTACDEAVGGNRQATTGVVRPNSANQKRQRIQRPSADGRLARPEAGFPGTWQQKPGQVSRSGEPARPSLCPSTVQAMTRSSISTSAAVTAGRDRHKFCQLLQRFRHAAEDRVMPRKLYKVLVNGRSCHGGSMEWSLPVRDPATGKYRPGSWHKVSGPLSMCESGIHLTTKPENWLTFGCQIFRAQPDSEPTQWYDDKCVVAGARLLYPVRKPAYWTQVEQFIGSIQSVPFFKPDGRPEPEWKLFTAGTWKAALEAAREAAKNAARIKAWNAARAEAWDAAWDAARNTARGAIWDAVWDAARNAVKAAAGGADAARNTTSGAIWDAVCVAERDAQLMASLHVCGPLAETHAQHIKARWRVWQKGYALLCDVGGALYVYAAEESER